jgi:signal transduction histidine kinase
MNNRQLSKPDSTDLKNNIIKDLPDNFVVIDTDGTILYVNDSWRDFARDNELPPEHCSEGTNYLTVCDEATGENSEEAPIAAEGIRDVIHGKRDYFELEYPCHAPNKRRWYIMKVIPLEDEKPRPVLAYHLNITKRKLSEIELEKLNETREMFSDVLRHDLKNPVGISKGFAEILYKDETDPKKLEIIEKIINNNNRAIELIEKAGDLARIECMDHIEYERLDLDYIIENVIDSLQDKLTDKNMNIVFVNQGGYYAYVNSIIEQAFSNLISNSIKYSPENSEIIVDIVDDNEYWKIRAIDSGPGVPDDEKERLFDRFKRGSGEKSLGKGIGLSIVKNVVELHGGNIGVEDNPEGKGSMFWITVKKAD